MLRVNAKEDYFFDEEYFNSLLNSVEFNSKLLIVKHEGEVCAGALFIITNKIMQYHLAGTLDKCIKVSPMKLIIDEARKIGSSLNLDYLFLGGGQSKDVNDTLYRFKSGFSNLKYRFQTWNLIVDINTYNKLVLEKNTFLDSGYFPLYRTVENEDYNIFLFGASGHAKVILDILKLNNKKVIGIFDNNPSSNSLLDNPVYKSEDLFSLSKPEDKIIIAIGDNELRKKKVDQLEKVTYTSAIHPNAVVSKNTNIGDGSVVMASSIINTGALIGNHVIINTGALIEHDCKIENFAHISPKAALAGNVTVKEGAQVGINSTVRQGITIGKWSIVGAGSVIVKDVPDYAVVVGNPGKVIKYTNE
jgi:acetyltransferase EpsM